MKDRLMATLQFLPADGPLSGNGGNALPDADFWLVCTKKDLLVQEVFGNSRLLLSKIKRVLR